MATTIISPTADAYIAQASPNSAYGSLINLICGQIILNYIPFQNRLVFRFDLTSYSSASIGLALLRLNVISAFFPGGVHELSAHELTTTDWLESEVSYTKRTNVLPWTTEGGDYDPVPFASTNVQSGITSIEMDVSNFIRSKRGEQANFILTLPSGLPHLNHYLILHSKEASNSSLRPSLLLVDLSPRIADNVHLCPAFKADQIRIAHMFDMLPVNNEISIQVNGYRNATTKALVTDADFTATIYDEAGQEVIDGGLDHVASGNYRGSLNGSGLQIGSSYRVVIEDTTETPSQTVWTRWFRASERPTTI